MKQYSDLLDRILTEGRPRKDRTGTGTIGVFGHEMKFDMRKGFPLLTTKKVYLRAIIHEMLWFLKGSTNIKYLTDNNVTIWDEWADADGELGPIYGYQWRNWRQYVPMDNNGNPVDRDKQPMIDGVGHYGIKYIDQIANIVKKLHNNPDDRRMMVSAWNVGEIDEMNLPPCHYMFHVSTFEMTYEERLQQANYDKEKFNPFFSGFEYWEKRRADDNTHTGINWNKDVLLDQIGVPRRWISLRWEQRSVDTFLGLPFNIASYAILLLMLAQIANMVPLELSCSLGDTHLYVNHIDQAKLQLSREPRELPIMKLNQAIKNIDDFKFEDFELLNYDPHPAIKGDISI
jgi:thymidylate synthase